MSERRLGPGRRLCLIKIPSFVTDMMLPEPSPYLSISGELVSFLKGHVAQSDLAGEL